MRVYTVHIRRHGLDIDRDIAVIKEGFCWPAFFFSAFWALWHRHWLVVLVLIAVPTLLAGIGRFAGLDPLTQTIINGVWSVSVGMLANDVRRAYLERANFLEVAVATGRNPDEALYQYLATPQTPQRPRTSPVPATALTGEARP